MKIVEDKGVYHNNAHKTNNRWKKNQKYTVGQAVRDSMSATSLQFLSVHILWDSSMVPWETFTKNGAL